MNASSFTSASIQGIPPKLESNIPIDVMINTNKFEPIHVQLNPTNKCNLKCKFCSCEAVDRTSELSLPDIQEFIATHSSIESITITGGGEPTIYPKFSQLITFLYNHGVSLGMASNGIPLQSWTADKLIILDMFKWIRISISKDSKYIPFHTHNSSIGLTLSQIMDLTFTDWALSYVVYGDYEENYEALLHLLDVYETAPLTHLRIVSDILNPNSEMFNKLQQNIPTDDLHFPVIWQDRAESVRGHKNCYMSQIKPVITAEGDIYPCCGAQYAINDKTGTYPPELRMGNIKDYQFAEPIDGTICDICYYDAYNSYITDRCNRFNKLTHKEFI